MTTRHSSFKKAENAVAAACGSATAPARPVQAKPAFNPHGKSNQRLSLAALKRWEALGFGLFFHFGMGTFDGEEFDYNHSSGTKPSTTYAPTALDVGQWLDLAKSAGARYAVLTAKHVAGHALWPSRYTDYHVGTSGNKTDVVRAFTEGCRQRGILPGLYYCAWDNHHRFGSVTRSDVLTFSRGVGADLWSPKDQRPFTTERYREFMWQQLDELTTGYGPLGEVWIDIPMVLPRDYRDRLYFHLAENQPNALIMFNAGIGDGTAFNVNDAWPTDLVAIERFMPNSHTGHVKWRSIEDRRYYIPGEVCDPIGKDWFYVDRDQPRSDAELLGMYLVSRSRGCNFLLNVPPDRTGRIPTRFADSLLRLRKNINGLKFGSATL
jgi:alpha-L-fucosidase